MGPTLYITCVMPDFLLQSETPVRFLVNQTAMVALVLGLYYRHYRDNGLVTAAALFDVFAFGVLSILSVVEFSLAAWFGLFATLVLFTLRSEPIGKVEIT